MPRIGNCDNDLSNSYRKPVSRFERLYVHNKHFFLQQFVLEHIAVTNNPIVALKYIPHTSLGVKSWGIKCGAMCLFPPICSQLLHHDRFWAEMQGESPVLIYRPKLLIRNLKSEVVGKLLVAFGAPA